MKKHRRQDITPKTTEAEQPIFTTPAKVDSKIHSLALATIRGAFGSGDARVRALGENYDAVMQEVNHILDQDQTTLTIREYAQATLRGEYGSEEEAKRRLGEKYEAVQAELKHILAEG